MIARRHLKELGDGSEKKVVFAAHRTLVGLAVSISGVAQRQMVAGYGKDNSCGA
jgi:hypothetical protein